MTTQHHVGAGFIGVILLGLSTSTTQAQAPPPEKPEYGDLLVERSMANAISDLQAIVREDSTDEDAMFALGIAQFLVSGENLFQRLHHYGYDPDLDLVGWMLPFRVNPLPVDEPVEPATYAKIRGIFKRWQIDLQQAERTLSWISQPDVSVRLKIGLVRLDFDGDKEAESEEALYRIFNRMQRRFEVSLDEAKEFEIAFDRGDVSWLRGYVQICLALSELALAHDWEDLYERTAHLTFRNPSTSYDFLTRPKQRGGNDVQWYYVDFATMIHSLHFPVVDPDRCRAAREHLLQAIEMSRDMWKHYNVESDDDREWLPNPSQGSVIPNGSVTKEEQEAWMLFLDEANAVLTGEHLLRFWRTADGLDREEGRGVNLMKVFEQPRTFDLILWLQGTGAQPYLEEGTLTTPQTWRRLNETFERQFFRNAFWFN